MEFVSRWRLLNCDPNSLKVAKLASKAEARRREASAGAKQKLWLAGARNFSLRIGGFSTLSHCVSVSQGAHGIDPLRFRFSLSISNNRGAITSWPTRPRDLAKRPMTRGI
jgi:hypothetical protein